MEVVIKIEVKDNNVDQALRILKRKLQREGFFKILKVKSNYEKPSERKKREIAIKFMNTNRQIFNKVVVTSLFGGCY